MGPLSEIYESKLLSNCRLLRKMFNNELRCCCRCWRCPRCISNLLSQDRFYRTCTLFGIQRHPHMWLSWNKHWLKILFKYLFRNILNLHHYFNVRYLAPYYNSQITFSANCYLILFIVSSSCKNILKINTFFFWNFYGLNLQITLSSD